jgi:hypothetical protein
VLLQLFFCDLLELSMLFPFAFPKSRASISGLEKNLFQF